MSWKRLAIVSLLANGVLASLLIPHFARTGRGATTVDGPEVRPGVMSGAAESGKGDLAEHSYPASTGESAVGAKANAANVESEAASTGASDFSDTVAWSPDATGDWIRNPPVDREAYETLLARAQSNEIDGEALERFLLRLLDAHPEIGAARLTLAEYYQWRNRFREAADQFVLAAARFPGDPGVALSLSFVLNYIGDHGGAVEALVPYVERFPDDADLRHALAEAYSETGFPMEALEQRLAWAELVGDSAHAHAMLAFDLRDAGLLEEALREFDWLIEEAPDDPATLRLRAETRAEMGQFDGAVDDMVRATAVAPENFQLRLVLIDVLRQAGRYGEALGELGAARALVPVGSAHHEELDRIEADIVAAAEGDGRKNGLVRLLNAMSRSM